MTVSRLHALTLTALLAGCAQPTTPPSAPSISPTGAVSVNGRTGARYFRQQLVVQLPPQDAAALAARLNAHIIDRIPQLNVVVLELPAAQDALETATLLNREGDVQYAAPHQLAEREPTPTRPEDPSLGAQGAAVQIFDALPQYALDLNHLHAQAAWDAGLTGAGVTVGVIDDPSDVSHPDLSATWSGKAYDPRGSGKVYTTAQSWLDLIDSLNGAVDGVVDPSIEHGTAVASTITAARDGRGIVGVAPGAKFQPSLIFAPGSVGAVGIAKAMLWQVDNGAQVLNNSWGGPGYDPTIKLAVDYALRRNVTVVASAGNSSREEWSRPAMLPGVIASAALDINNAKASFSTYGRHISVAAPGVDVLLASPLFINSDGTRKSGATPEGGSGYQLISGTSFSGPYTAGTAALILGAHPELDPYQVRRLMEETADATVGSNPSGFDRETGHGAIRLDRLAERLNSGPMPLKGGTARIQVQVKTPDGTFVPATTASDVILEGTGPDGMVYGAQTDSSGEALFVAIAPGTYTLRIGTPDLLVTGGKPEERGTYVGELTVASGDTGSAPTVFQLNAGYFNPFPTDPYEQNDTLAAAKPIQVGQATDLAYIFNKDYNSVTAKEKADVDFYRFTGIAGQKLDIVLHDKYYPGEPLGALWGTVYIRDAAGVTLKDSLGKPLKPNITTNILSVTLPSTGTYYLQVGAYSHLNPTGGEAPYTGTVSNSAQNKYFLELRPR
ncbi:S8 family serine peptidase [Deinococcus soli (ex Cha et al. 2016)]|uniref:Subtilisin family serine protease n=2 Tax=Deinococcus soli (ex Cha et al. 2016) TaxID=1309411 RepID=A0ACC6KQ32_9DEIO|nr:S8 family serine peptidase [Deinococcus soli (ex Cha et al. 2016)]MDR6221491.1 subtilisin family serine protease [Deinococcus soli (ex Cha et al. 2016)]MDR6331481.1 subtilisin family serine protease [Deinococcus soli (ex Cha et al. 2016)]MDR6754648.1 subtilisin family serine protease [Deinococcus soli (ex Cha et al. 2016)]GGB84258.1 serine protease [Deinococcus soli (ex Cha et al. 2016)]